MMRKQREIGGARSAKLAKSASSDDAPPTGKAKRSGNIRVLLLAFLAAAVATALVSWVLVVMIGHKQEERTPFVRVAEVTEISTDPVPWGLNWPHQFDGWKSTAGDRFYGGSSAMPESKLDKYPWLKRLYAGYAFSIDYRQARGHAYMLYDQGVTERSDREATGGGVFALSRFDDGVVSEGGARGAG